MGLDGRLEKALPGLHAGGVSDPAEEPELELRRALLTAWRAKWLVALFVIAGMALAYLHLLRVTPLYTSEARVLWEVDQGNVVDITPVASGLSSDFFSLASQIEIIESGKLLERVVRELDLVNDPVFNPALAPPGNWTRWLSLSTLLAELKSRLPVASDGERGVEPSSEDILRRTVDALRAAVEAEWLDGTYVLIIRATTSNAERSQEIANAMARFYILDQLETKFEATRQATEWLSERVAELRVALENAERAVKDYAASIGVTSEEALAAATRQLKDLRERERSLKGERTALAARLARLDDLRDTGDFTAIAELTREPALAALAAEISRLAPEEDAAARAEAVARFDAELGATRTRMSLSLSRLERQLASVGTSIAGLEERLETQSRSLVELRQLQREAEASRLIYEAFLARLKETSVQEGIQRPDARVLTAAEIPSAPSSPDRGATLLFGAGGGFFLALALVFLFERLNTSFRSAEEMEARTGHAAIGTIPIAPVRRRALLSYLLRRPNSSFAEALRNLRTSILLANVDNPPRVIMLTSSVPGEGKTTTCIGLAQISRALGKRVLLLECDLRRRKFRTYFDLGQEGGLLSVLSGMRGVEEAIQRDEETGIDILAGEESRANAADVFSSQRFAEFLAAMREQYDFIFIDTPPVLVVPDARVIGKQVDAVVFSVRWNRTPRETVQQALRLFEQVNVRIAGLVLNLVDLKRMTRYGYTSYSYREAEKYHRN